MRIYISGQISGLPYEVARKNFRDAEIHLKQIYPEAEIISPMNNGLPRTARWGEHMIADLMLEMTCDTIYMLHGWKHSNGANIEYVFAEMEGLRIIYEERKN